MRQCWSVRVTCCKQERHGETILPYFSETRNYTSTDPKQYGQKSMAEKLQALLLLNCTLRYLVLVVAAHIIAGVAKLRDLFRGPAVSLSGPGALCRAPALSVSGPGAVFVGPRRSMCQVLRARHSLCRAPTLLSGPGALCVGPGALCVGPRRSLSRGPAVSLSGPDALCVRC